MGDRSSRIWKRLIMVGVSFLVSVCLAEVLLRIAWENPYQTEIPSHIVRIRVHHALKNLSVDRSAIYPNSPIVRMRTDDRSYLLPSHRFEHPDATIAFLGGSTTECAAVDEELRFPALVSTLLEEHGLRVNTLNAAVSGNTAHDSLNMLLNHVVEDHPDIVVMLHAANDIGILTTFGSYDPRNGGPATHRDALRWLGQAASSRLWFAGAIRAWATAGPLRLRTGEPRATGLNEPRPRLKEEFAKRLRAFVGICRAFHIEPVLMTQPSVDVGAALMPDFVDPRSQEIFNQLIRDVAKQENVVLIDVARYLVEHVEEWEEPRKVFYDGIHVTNRGSRIYAEYITQRLRESVLVPPPDSQP